MKATPLTIIDLGDLTRAIPDYANFPVASVNDHAVKVSVMTESYYWHYHPNSDETFMVIEGVLLIDLEAKTVELLPGQLFTIPKNVVHRTRPGGERSVNVTFELTVIDTVRVEV